MKSTPPTFETEEPTMNTPVSRVLRRGGRQARALFAAILLAALGVPAVAQQKAHSSPEALAQAFEAAVTNRDEEGLKALLGADFRKLIPPVGADIRQRFLDAWAQSHRIVADGDAKAMLAVGDDGWTLPVPLVKGQAGWHFDTKAGAQEIQRRQIGRNELAAMQVALAYCDAQKDYAVQDPNRDGILDYARKIESSPGQRDGLYWPAKEGEEPSPLGPLVAQARAAGAKKGEGYHGYRYKILTAQGAEAPGGATDYVVAGRMIGGFALVAWPVKYGDTGIMSFIVNHEGVVYEKDLGPGTGQLAANLTRYNPDKTWKKSENP
jgi:DUF2950 family protein